MSDQQPQTSEPQLAAATIATEPVAVTATPRVPDGTVTMAEVHEQMVADARQAQALAARAGRKVEECSWSLGPHSQPVYWCKTCHADQKIGVCLGCSMNCHLDHDVEELFEKRGFRCDCGNGVAGGHCTLNAEKDHCNASNTYNHNFIGQYCYCDGTYDQASDVMFCCLLCQDWYHDRCSDSRQPLDHHDDTADFFCRRCLALPQNDILTQYLDQAEEAAKNGLSFSAANSAANTPSMSRAVSLTSESPVAAASAQPSPISLNSANQSPAEESKEGPSSSAPESTEGLTTPSRKRKAEDTSDAVAPAVSDSPAPSVVCTRVVIESPPTSSSSPPPAAIARDRFVAGNWNLFLCSCPACALEYKSRGLSWLLEEELEADDAKNEHNVLGDMTDADTAAPLEASFDAEAMTASMVDRMPRAAAIDVVTQFAAYQKAIARQLDEFQRQCPGAVVTSEVMLAIAARAKRESMEGYREIKRARYEESPPE